MAAAPKYVVKAQMSRRNKTKYTLLMTAVGLISMIGAALFVYNLVRSDYLFALCYLLAVMCGVLYIVIEINTIFSTYIAADKKTLHMRNWNNCFLPYDIHHKAIFFREFIPAKTETAEVRIKDIREILLGSKNFVKRYCHENDEFIEKIKGLEKLAFLQRKKSVRNMDLFYIATKSGECCFMPITGFDETEIVRLVNYLEKQSRAQVRCNNKSVRRRIMMMKR
ncbi:MAG: hypothetical protein N2171_00365 [Clostridia bacterium]|nr:hypothetical protein [Clostridia bacterium]